MKTTAAVATLLLLAAWPALAVCPNWNVVQPQGYPGGGPVLMVDLDGDGVPDAVAAPHGIGVLWAPALQTFTTVRDIAFDSVVAADVNGDGLLDLVGAVPRLGATMEVFLNLGGRRFDRQRSVFTWNLLRLAAANLDGDRFADLFAITDVTNEIVTLHNNGSGDFETPVQLHLHAQPTILIGADFDGDRRTDAAFIDGDAKDILRTTLGWSVAASAPITTAITVDFDRDGRPDLALIAGNRVLLLRPGSGRFEQLAELTASGMLTGIVTADFDHNGTTDLAVAAGDHVAVWLADGVGGFRRVADTPITRPKNMAVVDFNSDAIPDLAVDGVLYPGLGNGTFALPRTMQRDETYYAAAGDVDGDGDTDFVAAGNQLFLWRNDGGSLVREVLGSTASANGLQLADLDGDGKPEIIVSTEDLGSRTILVYRAGALWFSLPADRGYLGFAAGDFDGDGRKEIAVRANGAVQLFAATPQPHLVGQYSDLPSFEPHFAADFDHDGRDDLLLMRPRTVTNPPYTEHDDGFVMLLPGRGNFAFGPLVTVAENVTVTDINIGDFDGDGDRDVAMEVRNTTEIAYGDGRGTFLRVPLPKDPFGSSFDRRAVMVVADLDGDGRDEILGTDGGVIMITFLGGRGQVRRNVILNAPLRYTFAVGQVDGDGLDIVTFGTVYPGICEPSTHRRPR